MAASYLLRDITAHLTPTEIKLFENESIPTLKLGEFNIATTAMFNFCLAKKIPARQLVDHILRQSTLEYTLFSHPEFAPYLYPPDDNSNLGYYFLLAKYHRPLKFFEYYFTLYMDIFYDLHSTHICDIAVRCNYTALLCWLRNPHTGVGAYVGHTGLCTNAAKHGNIAMLEHLRTPFLKGTRCPWGAWACVYACENGHLDTLRWLRNPHTGGGVCPWFYQYCIVIAEQNSHSHIVTWMSAQAPE